MFLGVPFNIASYALLTHIIAELCDLDVGEFVWTGGDCHIYLNHFLQVKEQISRLPVQLPKLIMPELKTLGEYIKLSPSDYILEGYTPMPSIKAPMAV